MFLYVHALNFLGLRDLLLLFILTANGFSPGGSGTTIRHNIQTTDITQNNTTIKQNTLLITYKIILLSMCLCIIPHPICSFFMWYVSYERKADH
jgi:hypothetical protein